MIGKLVCWLKLVSMGWHQTGINGLAPLYPASSFRSDWIWRLSRSSTARISFLNGFKDVQSLRRSNIIWSATHLSTFDDTSVLLSSSFMSGSPAEGPACFCGKHHRKSLSMKNPVLSSVHLIIPMLNFLPYCTILMRILQPQSVCWLQGTIKSKSVTSDFCLSFSPWFSLLSSTLEGLVAMHNNLHFIQSNLWLRFPLEKLQQLPRLHVLTCEALPLFPLRV